MALRFYKLETDCTIGAPDVSWISPVLVSRVSDLMVAGFDK
jgi:hypothetical protein